MSPQGVRRNLQHIAEVVGVMEELVPALIRQEAVDLLNAMINDKEVSEGIWELLEKGRS